MCASVSGSAEMLSAVRGSIEFRTFSRPSLVYRRAVGTRHAPRLSLPRHGADSVPAERVRELPSRHFVSVLSTHASRLEQVTFISTVLCFFPLGDGPQPAVDFFCVCGSHILQPVVMLTLPGSFPLAVPATCVHSAVVCQEDRLTCLSMVVFFLFFFGGVSFSC